MQNYILIRSKRKTLSIRIRSDAIVEVRAPIGLSKKYIDAYILEKHAWIEKYLNEKQMQKKLALEFTFKEGTLLPFLGKEYQIVNSNSFAFDYTNFFLPCDESDKARQLMINFYKNQAAIIIPKRVLHFQKLMDLSPNQVKISTAFKQWGSCSGKNNLNFSWILMLAPVEAIDYVIVHELAHIKEHNHSKNFWQIVGQTLPQYKSCEKLLSQAQKRAYIIMQ